MPSPRWAHQRSTDRTTGPETECCTRPGGVTLKRAYAAGKGHPNPRTNVGELSRSTTGGGGKLHRRWLLALVDRIDERCAQLTASADIANTQVRTWFSLATLAGHHSVRLV